MNNITQNLMCIDKMWGLFIGQFNDNTLHRHYALQISVASKEKFEIIDENKIQTAYKTCFINSNVKHQFKSKEPSLIILINPFSDLGHQLYNKYRNEQIVDLNGDLNQISAIFYNYLKKELTPTEFVISVNNCFTRFKCLCESQNHFADDRIYKAIQYLEQNFERIVSLEEIANFCFLSETRFLHLFKEKTNLNFRRYQLWNKLIKSLSYLSNNSITKTAHQFGFTDSSHYTRTFKETFGLSPKIISSLK